MPAISAASEDSPSASSPQLPRTVAAAMRVPPTAWPRSATRPAELARPAPASPAGEKRPITRPPEPGEREEPDPRLAVVVPAREHEGDRGPKSAEARHREKADGHPVAQCG